VTYFQGDEAKAEQFPPKFQGLVLGLVELIDAKGINVTQPIWLSGCLTQAQKRVKNTKKVVLALFWAYIGQLDGQITLMYQQKKTQFF